MRFGGSAAKHHRLRLWAAAALCALTVAASAAAAPPSTVRLTYIRGPGAERCPSETELRDGVLARLGRDPFSAAGPRLVRVVIDRTRAGLVARVEARDERGQPAGERRLTSPRTDCAELAAAVGLAIAIAIDPASAWGRPPDSWDEPASQSQPASAEVAPPASAEVAPPASAPPAPRTRMADAGTARSAPVPSPGRGAPISWFAVAGPLLALGAAPGVTAGFALQLEARRGALSLALEARADVPREAAVQDGGVSASLGLGALLTCYHLGHLAACGLLAAGGLRGSARGLADARADLTPYVGAGGRLAFDLALGGRFGLRLHADVLATLTPTALKVDALEAWKTPPASGTLGLSLAVRLR